MQVNIKQTGIPFFRNITFMYVMFVRIIIHKSVYLFFLRFYFFRTLSKVI